MSIANGFYDDCQDLIQRCLKLEVLHFQSFCNVWKEMLFTYIYQEVSSYGEIGEISEEFIRIAKHIMLLDTGNFKESKIGLYIVYALITQQPFANFAYLRICAGELQELKRFENAIRLQRDNDALFIFGRVLVKHTRYTGVDRERGFETAFAKYLSGSSVLQNNKKEPTGIFSDQNEETDMLKELGTIAKKYTLCRDRLNKKIDLGMKYVNPDLPSQLTVSFQKLLKGYYEKDDDAEIRLNTVTAIKQRAMTKTAKPLHRLSSSQQSTSIDKKEKYIHSACSSKSTEKDIHDDKKEVCSENVFSRIRNMGQYKKITKPYENKITNSLNDHGLKLIEDYAIEEKNTDVDTNEISDTKDRKRKKNTEKKEIPTTNQKKAKTVDTKSREGGKDDKETKELSENEGEILEVEEISNDKELNKNLPIIQPTDESECEIEIIDYATNSKIPVHTFFSTIFKSANL